MAKMQGLDPNEMASIINEDYHRQSQQREAAKSQALSGIQQRRDEKMSSLKSEKDGTFDILKSDFEANAGIRDAAYQAKLAAQQKELDAAKAAYDEAIHRAKTLPPNADRLEETGRQLRWNGTFPERLQAKVQEVIKGFSADSDLGCRRYGNPRRTGREQRHGRKSDDQGTQAADPLSARYCPKWRKGFCVSERLATQFNGT